MNTTKEPPESNGYYLCEAAYSITNDSNSPQTSRCELYSFVMYTVIVGVMCIAGSLGNIISFLVFHNDKLKTSFSLLLQSLAIIDTLLLVTVFPLYSLNGFVHFTGTFKPFYNNHFYPILMVFVYPCAFVFQTSTVWLTVLVAINRYIAVCMPYEAMRMCTVSKAKKQMAAVLLLATLYNIPKFAEGTFTVKSDRFCLLETALTKNKVYEIAYNNVSYTIFLFVLPLALLTFLNFRLVASFNDSKRKRHTMQTARQRHSNSVTLVLIVVLIVFIVCQFPAFMTQIFWTILPEEARFCDGFQFYFSRISNSLVTCNSSVNFFIYLAFNRRFRRIFKQMCSFICDKNNGKTSSHRNYIHGRFILLRVIKN